MKALTFLITEDQIIQCYLLSPHLFLYYLLNKHSPISLSQSNLKLTTLITMEAEISMSFYSDREGAHRESHLPFTDVYACFLIRSLVQLLKPMKTHEEKDLRVPDTYYSSSKTYTLAWIITDPNTMTFHSTLVTDSCLDSLMTIFTL